MVVCLIQGHAPVPVKISDGDGWRAARARSAMDVDSVSGIEKFRQSADALRQFLCEVFRVEVANGNTSYFYAVRLVTDREGGPVDINVCFVFLGLEVHDGGDTGASQRVNRFNSSWA